MPYTSRYTRREMEDNYDELYKYSHDTNELIIRLHASIGCSVSPSTIERGKITNVKINHSALFDGKPLTYVVEVNNSPITSSGYDINNTTSFYVKLIINNEDPAVKDFVVSRTVTSTAYFPKFFGRSINDNITIEQILEGENKNSGENCFLGRVISSSASSTRTLYPAKINNNYAGDYIWLVMPSNQIISSVKSNGFDVPMTLISKTFTVNGISTTYNAYRSANKINDNNNITINIS